MREETSIRDTLIVQNLDVSKELQELLLRNTYEIKVIYNDGETMIETIFDNFYQANRCKETRGGNILLIEKDIEILLSEYECYIIDHYECKDTVSKILNKVFNDNMNKESDDFQFVTTLDEYIENTRAIMIINDMNTREFQERLLNGTLPDFKRKYVNPLCPPMLERGTYFPFRFMTEEEFQTEEYNQGYIHRYKLDQMNIEEFKNHYYFEEEKESFSSTT